MVMPGIHDMHAHPVQGGFQEQVECSFPFTTPLDAIALRVRACAAKTPKGAWIRGGQWAAETLESDRPPTRALLDAAAPDHPVFLIDSTYHNAWVNSRALALLGIDAKTPDPSGGVIVREPGGAPTGVLIDNAAYHAMKRLPVNTPEQYQAAIRWAVAKMNALGVVAMKDALADGHAARAYAALDRAGKLDMRVGTSRPWRASWTESDADEARNLERWRDDETAHVRSGFAKIFVDGIPPTRTAALLEPYAPDPKHAAGFKGELQHSPADLNAALVKLDALGLTVKMHATGDAALRAGLDAIAAARKANGDSGLRHEIAHAELASPRTCRASRSSARSPSSRRSSGTRPARAGDGRGDRPRAREPLLADQDDARRRRAPGLRLRLAVGRATPSPWPESKPWSRAATLRKARRARPRAGHPLADALAIFTRNGASALRLEKESGSIEVGKTADLIVLDRNLFEIPPEQIGDTVVLETVFEGRVVSAHRAR
jgi:predicted amidohydrolase YtcJ